MQTSQPGHHLNLLQSKYTVAVTNVETRSAATNKAYNKGLLVYHSLNNNVLAYSSFHVVASHKRVSVSVD
jgi:aryl-alcohol dehydrogenase-like predicted oxidoreductase